MRAYENGGVANGGGAGTQSAQPTADKRRLVRCNELRGAQVQHDRPVGRKPDLSGEGVAVAGGCPVEPVIVGVGPRDDDALAGHTVHLHGLATLALVPYQQAVEGGADNALVGQIVPAGDRKSSGNMSSPSSHHDVVLGWPRHQRGHQHEMGTLIVEEALHANVRRQGALEPAQQGVEAAQGPSATPPR